MESSEEQPTSHLPPHSFMSPITACELFLFGRLPSVSTMALQETASIKEKTCTSDCATIFTFLSSRLLTAS
jgi:hypothetical protein